MKFSFRSNLLRSPAIVRIGCIFVKELLKKLEVATSIETTLTLGVNNDYIVTLNYFYILLNPYIV